MLNVSSPTKGICNRQRISVTTQGNAKDYKNVLGNRCYIEMLRVEKVLKGHSGCVNSVLFSEFGDFIYTGSDDTNVNVYKTEGGTLVDTISTIHTNNIFYAKDLPFSNRELIVTCAADGRVAITNMESRGTRQLYKHRGRAHRISVIPNTVNEFYSCGEDGVCCLFDIRDGARAVFANPDISAGVTPAATTQFSSGRNPRTSIYTIGVNPSRPHEVALGGVGSHVALYDNRRIAEPFGYLCPSHMAATSAHVTGLKYNYSGETLIASYSGGDIYSFELNDHVVGERRQRSTTPVSAHEDSTVVKAPVLATIKEEEEASSSSSSCAASNTVESDLERVTRGYTARYKGHRNRDTVKQVGFVGNRSEFVVSGSDCGHILLWDSQSAEVVAVLKADSRGAVNCFGTHPNLPYFCSSGLDIDAKLWSPTGERSPLVEGTPAWEAAQKVITRNTRRNGGHDHEEEEEEEDEVDGEEGIYSQGRLRALLLMLLREEMEDRVDREQEERDGAAPAEQVPSRNRNMIRLLTELMPGVAAAFLRRHAEGVDEDDDDDDDDDEDDETNEQFDDELDEETHDEEDEDDEDDDESDGSAEGDSDAEAGAEEGGDEEVGGVEDVTGDEDDADAGAPREEADVVSSHAASSSAAGVKRKRSPVKALSPSDNSAELKEEEM